MAYSTDSDLAKLRPDILSFGVDSWDDQRADAEGKINRTLEVRWYRSEAIRKGLSWQDVPFDPDKIKANLTLLSAYKTLVGVYLFLAKNGVDDGFRKQSELFEELYEEELREVLAIGIDYDWGDSGVVGSSDTGRRSSRTLKRC